MRPWPSTRVCASLPAESMLRLVPTMSAPAAASASVIASPIPRRQPVTSATLPVRSKLTRRPRRSRPGSSSPFRRRAPRMRLRSRRGGRRRDESVDGDLAVGEQADRVVEVGTFVDPRTDDRELAPEDAEEVDRGGVEWIATTTRRPRGPSARLRSGCPATAPDTSKDTSAPAPSVHFSTYAATSRSRGSSVRSPTRRPVVCGRRWARRGGRRLLSPGDRRHEQPDRPASDDDRALPGGELGPATSWTATAVGSASAAVRSDMSAGSATSVSAGTVQRGWSDPGASIPRKERRWQM